MPRHHFFTTNIPMLFPLMPNPKMPFTHPEGSSPWNKPDKHRAWLLDQRQSVHALQNKFCTNRNNTPTCEMAQIYMQSIRRRLSIHKNTQYTQSDTYKNNVFTTMITKISNEEEAEGFLSFRLGSLAFGGNFTAHKNAHAVGLPLFPLLTKPLSIGLAVLKVGISSELPPLMRSCFISMGYFIASCMPTHNEALTCSEYIRTTQLTKIVSQKNDNDKIKNGWCLADKASNDAFNQVCEVNSVKSIG